MFDYLIVVLPVTIWLAFLISAARKENEWISKGCAGNCAKGRKTCTNNCPL